MRRHKAEDRVPTVLRCCFCHVKTLLQCRLEDDAADLRVAFRCLLCVGVSRCRAWHNVLITQSVTAQG